MKVSTTFNCLYKQSIHKKETKNQNLRAKFESQQRLVDFLTTFIAGPYVKDINLIGQIRPQVSLPTK